MAPSTTCTPLRSWARGNWRAASGSEISAGMIRFNSRPLSGPEEPKSHGRAVPLSDQGFFPLVRTHIIFVASPEQMSKEELRQRIERDPQLKKDFDFLI